jgi:hypothetical protein
MRLCISGLSDCRVASLMASFVEQTVALNGERSSEEEWPGRR